MSIKKWTTVDSDDSIADFLRATHGLHDSCLTSAEFTDGRFVDDSGSMHCGRGDQATLTLRLDRQSGTDGVEKYVLLFDGVFDFRFFHNSALDGLILSCSVSLVAGTVHFRCNPSYEEPDPVVHAKSFSYLIAPIAASASATKEQLSAALRP
jgi:hypothetical protein